MPAKPPDISNVPVEYRDPKLVFNKARATLLPSHGPYDCPIDLLLGTSPPKGSLYFLTRHGSFCPRIDYRGLNEITVSNLYLLPFMSIAFELLQGATLFTKLDLHNAYHLIQIREGDE